MATPSGQEQDPDELELYVGEPQQSTSTMKEDPLFSSTNRKFTDIWFFIAQGIGIILSLSLSMYCSADGGLHHFPKSCNEHGTMCDTKNEEVRDVTNIFGDEPETMEVISNDFSVYSTEIITLCCVAAGTSYMLLLLLRASTICFPYLLAIGYTAASITLLVVLWRHQVANNLFTMPAIVFTLTTIGLGITVIRNRKEIPHAMRMFEETGNYTGGASNPFFSSALTFISVSIIWWCGIFFARSIGSAEVPLPQGTGKFVIGYVRYCNVIVMLWMVQFIYECQCLVLAGSISSIFFNRENTSASSSVHSSTFFFLKYHLGTVSANSLALMFVQFLHILFFLLRLIIFIGCKFIPILGTLIRICLTGCFQEMTELEMNLKFLTRSVSTLTAIYGYNFQKSIKNVGRFWKGDIPLPLTFPTIVGGLMLFLAKMFVVIVTVLISRFIIEIHSIKERNNQWNEIYLLGITALLAYLISNSILRVYEMSANAIIVCFCVDDHINNGTSRPYFMTASLMEFAEIRMRCVELEMIKELDKII